ncbi:MAG: major facilitator superfamily domain-containing protein 1 [Bacteroidales bacterium]|jgi:MFS family permease|nr:MFS transporter [Bacteroidota bacterium]NLN99980.1 major facilitator superfamily domain-containing protein 1 [Bacteroidales bacterium]
MADRSKKSGWTSWLALACLVVPMFASYFFDDMFSTLSHLFEHPEFLELGWNAADYGLYASGYSVLCVFGGLVVCGMLLDKWGVRITGSIFVGMMGGGAALVAWAITSGLAPKTSLSIAYVGCMFFGLGSEIAGVAVTRSIAKWFKGRNMAFAMGLQLAIARLGTAFALVISPKLVATKAAGEVYTLSETARPAFLGLLLMLAGIVLWAIFVSMDARFDKAAGLKDRTDTAKADQFRFSDVLKLLKNKQFILIALLCVFFYSSVISFKKFASAILIPRFDVPVETASWMVSMLPFATVIFAPLFGIMVDRIGKGTRWMIVGSLLALMAHLLLAFGPAGVPACGYLSMIFLGFGYSLVPAALWPSVPKIVPDKVLGTAFSLIYWVQNLGLMLFKMLAGKILAASKPRDAIVSSAPDFYVSGAIWVEVMFVVVCVIALLLAIGLRRSSRRHPELRLDVPVSSGR